MFFNKTLERKGLITACKQLNRKIPDPRNANQHYEWCWRQKNKNSVKKSEIITYQPKSFEDTNIADIKSVIREHPKNSHQLLEDYRKGWKSRFY